MVLSIILIGIFVGLLIFLGFLKKQKKSFNFRVLTALIIGLVFGLIVQLGLGTAQSNLVDQTGTVVETYTNYSDVTMSDSGFSDNEGNPVTNVYVAYSDLGLDETSVVSTFGQEALKYEGILVDSVDDFTNPTYAKTANTASGNLIEFMSIISGIYIALLKLIVIPLIFISITTAIINARGRENLGKKVSKVIGWLLITVAISAVVGVGTSLALGIDGNALVSGSINAADVTERASALTEKTTTFTDMSVADLILSPIPSDFSFLVGSGSSPALTTVLFGMFLGYAILQVDKRKPKQVALFIDLLNSSKEVVLSLVREVLKLTPFAIVALMASFMATTSLNGMSQLLLFVIGTYVAIIIMYLIHLIILTLFGLSPTKFAKKTYPVLLFGFGSRSSMAALSLNTQTQKEELGVDEVTADLAGTFSVTIGQNGCAGIYPAMVAVMAMQAMGNDITIPWILMLIAVITISSFGIAGVGGGASFAAIAVLSMLGLPVTIAAILISVEPLLDMARTALNISDGMLVGAIVSKSDKEINMDVYNG